MLYPQPPRHTECLVLWEMEINTFHLISLSPYLYLLTEAHSSGAQDRKPGLWGPGWDEDGPGL